MFTFLKANVAAMTATLADYTVTISIVYFFKTIPTLAAVIGTIIGGIVSFVIGRYWAFEASDKNTATYQFFKYLLVWSGNLLLSISCVYLFTKFTDIHYIIAKVFTSFLVAFGYNYPLQKKYVFK